MSLRSLASGDLTHTFRPLPLAVSAHRMRAVVAARMVDELTGLGVASVTIRSAIPGLVPRVSAGGVAGLSGNPGRLFPHLAANPVDLTLDVSAPGYSPRRLEAALGPINTGLGAPADFPLHFEAIDLGQLPMHRLPVVLQGRAMRELGAERVPLAGVDITITGIWSTEPEPDAVPPDSVIEPPELLSLSPGLYRDRPALGTAMRERALVVAPQPKHLLATADRGAVQVRVSDSIGLLVNDLLALAPGAPDAEEYIEIGAIAAGVAPTDPAVVTLAHPLARVHPEGREAFPCSQGVAGGVFTPLIRGGLAGDRVLHPTAIPGGLGAVDSIEITGAPAHEYQIARRYETQSNALGDYRPPPIGRVAWLRIAANRADFTQPIEIDLRPAYPGPVQQLDFVERP